MGNKPINTYNKSAADDVGNLLAKLLKLFSLNIFYFNDLQHIFNKKETKRIGMEANSSL